jgi:hypothetical protein
MRARLSLLAILIAAATSSARADVVVLRDGRQLQGRTSSEGDELVIRRKHGEVRVKKAEVLRIDKEDDVYSQHERKSKELGSGTADERYQLGVWSRDHGLDAEARTAFLSVLKLDPDHAGARAALGYVRDDAGRWITEEDRMRLQGLVKFQGRWMTPAEKVRAETELAERRAAARELAKKAEEEKLAKRQAKLDEERAARLARIQAYEEELARARARRAAADEANYGLGLGVQQGPYGYVGGVYGGYPVGYVGWPRGAYRYSYFAGPPLSNRDVLIYAGWARGLGRGTVRPFTGTTVTVTGGGLYSGGAYRGYGYSGYGGYGSSSTRQRTGWGLGVNVQGSYQSKNGRTQVTFRTGF